MHCPNTFPTLLAVPFDGQDLTFSLGSSNGTQNLDNPRCQSPLRMKLTLTVVQIIEPFFQDKGLVLSPTVLNLPMSHDTLRYDTSSAAFVSQGPSACVFSLRLTTRLSVHVYCSNHLDGSNAFWNCSIVKGFDFRLEGPSSSLSTRVEESFARTYRSVG